MMTNNLLENVLIVDDDVSVQDVSMRFFQKIGCNCKIASNASEALKILHEHCFDLVLSDIVMPGIDGVEFMKEAKKNFPHLDFIIMTGYASEYMCEDIIIAGATDYLTKSYSLGELRAKIKRIEREKRVLKDLKETNAQLEAAMGRANQMALEAEVAKQDLIVQSRTDSLTGVFNRRAILSEVEAELSRAQREKKNVSLSMLDVDHFKKINDTYGHTAGDGALREVVRRIGKSIRIYDSLGRFGGEEFLIVFPGAKASDAYSIAERVCSAIDETDFCIDGSRIRVTASQGVVTGDGDNNMDELIDRADKALCQAKANGRGRIEQTVFQL